MISRFYQYHKRPNGRGPMTRLLDDVLSSNERGCALVASVGDRIVGSAILARFPGNEEFFPDWWLFGIAVHILLRGAGIGESIVGIALHQAVLLGAKSVYLSVSVGNKAALGLYEKMGFKEVSTPNFEIMLKGMAKESGHQSKIFCRKIVRV